ncbi:acyl carrier protein [Streptomyces sparsogenes]|uniref:acyl carrier protein n=1 Tax=Streptomyces sparsogenes TaxID=67365 RepID=UPI0033D253F7
MAEQSTRVTERDVLRVIEDHLVIRGVSAERIVRGAAWKADLGIDSLDILTLTQELEDTFRVKIGEEDAIELRTVGDAVDFIVRQADDRTADKGANDG